MFVDIVEIKVRAGKGGRGIVAFRHEKNVVYGGPSGGNGGPGGSIILAADPHERTLAWFKGRSFIAARNGGPGGPDKMTGKKGEDRAIPVPVGTVVYEEAGEDKVLLGDLAEVGQSLIVAKGGRGGKGNASFATPTRQAPEIAQPGEPGEEKALVLELKLLADVGVVGKPNAGKSTLLSVATKAKPKIAPYPFTTKEPVLGIVDVGWQRFVLAEIPGLIEGAHLGKGLGKEFLRHAERTKLLIHLVDGSSESPEADWAQVNEELKLYSADVGAKEQVLVINKTDMPEVQEAMSGIRRLFKGAATEIYFISAATGEGVQDLMKRVATRLQDVEARQLREEKPEKVFHPRPVDVVEPVSGRDGE